MLYYAKSNQTVFYEIWTKYLLCTVVLYTQLSYKIYKNDVSIVKDMSLFVLWHELQKAEQGALTQKQMLKSKQENIWLA